jgi:hypothetical protein
MNSSDREWLLKLAVHLADLSQIDLIGLPRSVQGRLLNLANYECGKSDRFEGTAERLRQIVERDTGQRRPDPVSDAAKQACRRV